MTWNVKLLLLGLVMMLAMTTLGTGQEPGTSADRAGTPEALQAEIEALKAPKVAWREIDWKSCLIEGLQQARAQSKPALLWVFIDRPVDDARC